MLTRREEKGTVTSTWVLYEIQTFLRKLCLNHITFTKSIDNLRRFQKLYNVLC